MTKILTQQPHPKFPDHHKRGVILDSFRDIIFGIEDGMVSTFGVVTGIALASNDHSTVLLSGVVVIAVESLSMGIGSYISNKAERDISRRKLAEERIETEEFPEQEKQELTEFYIKDGWPKEFAQEMTSVAYKDKEPSEELEYPRPRTALNIDQGKTIFNSEDVFKSWIDSDFKDWRLNQSDKKTPEIKTQVYEMAKNANYSQIFGSLNDDLDKLCLTQHQIAEFCAKNQKYLRGNGWATFFLFKVDGKYYVAFVDVSSVGLDVFVDRFGGGGVWGAEDARRVVVPQLEA